MRLRSLLFVPGDRPERFGKAAASGADAVILDLEDAVAGASKDMARACVARHLAEPAGEPFRFVRINPIDAGMVAVDLAAARDADGLVLPKAAGAAEVTALREAWGPGCPPILPIAAETPGAVPWVDGYADAGDLAGLTWGAEDLAAAIGAGAVREPDGRYTPPLEQARALTLFAAHAAGVAAIETVYPDVADHDGLLACAMRAARDGFTGMLAIHPAQVPVINVAFTPSMEQVDHARRVIEVFASETGVGAFRLEGRMIDRAHLKLAERVIQQARATAPQRRSA